MGELELVVITLNAKLRVDDAVEKFVTYHEKLLGEYGIPDVWAGRGAPLASRMPQGEPSRSVPSTSVRMWSYPRARLVRGGVGGARRHHVRPRDLRLSANLRSGLGSQHGRGPGQPSTY